LELEMFTACPRLCLLVAVPASRFG
jgi:hypothetical protein